MKEIKEGLDSISWGLFFMGLFLAIGTCNQHSNPIKTDFQYCKSMDEENKVICFLPSLNPFESGL